MVSEKMKDKTVCVVGLGYVGLPLAKAFSKHLKTIGFDVDKDKIKNLENNNNDILCTSDPSLINQADFVIIAVPTPITKSKEPDLSYVKSASEIVGKNLKKGAIVVLESTVYPGVTEQIVKPILEKESGLKYGADFKIGYSPERVNPGDEVHTIDKITKIVAGMDEETTETLAELYGIVTNVYKAKNIKTAEAAKVIENIQRDLNIALMNELAIIFKKMDIDIYDVIETASTKWNFHKYLPGLVGGHCIPVDPYYLLYKSEQLGYHPQVITAGRKINDEMPVYIFNLIQKEYNNKEKVIKNSKVLFLGVTFKENINDLRNTRTKDLIEMFKSYGANVFAFDPNIPRELIENNFGITGLDKLPQDTFDCVVVTAAHKEFLDLDFAKFGNSNTIYVDIRNIMNSLKGKIPILSLGKDI